MGGNWSYQGIQCGRGQTSSTTTSFMFVGRISQISQSWDEEGFRSLDQALLMCEMVDQYTSRSAQVARAEDIKTKKDR